MPEVGNNSTESRLSRFIEGCSQLQEIYAVAPLTYTNIMGEWWQRINDIIYTLGLTDTENNVVNIAWTVPVPGRKRSPFYEEELSTKTPEGVSVSESSRVSHVARSGTRDAATNARVNKAHKYGFIQSVDALFQRNVDTWGNVYEYFWNQTHDPATGDLLPSASVKEPADLTEMLFGRQGIGDEDITSLFEDATRNLAGDDRGLVNSMKHVIENIFGIHLYDWLDAMDANTSTGLGGLEKFFFGQNEDGSPLGENAYTSVLNRLTTGGVATETVKIIDTFGQALYDWLNQLGKVDPNNIQELLFGTSTNFQTIWERLTTGGVINETIKVIDTFGEDFYNWLNNASKQCNLNSVAKYSNLYRRVNGNWSRLSATQYQYKGKFYTTSKIPTPVYDTKKYIYPDVLNGTRATVDGGTAQINISALTSISGVSTMETLLKAMYIDIASNTEGQTPLLAEIVSPVVGNIAYVAIKFVVNGEYSDYAYEVTKIGFFEYLSSGWKLVESTYGNGVPGVFESAAYSVPQGDTSSVVRTCLVEIEDPTYKAGPATIQEMLFGNASSLCDVWKTSSSAGNGLLQTTQELKDAIGEDFLDWLKGDTTVCVGGAAIPKPGPHSLKELLFGSMPMDEICRSLSKMSGDSIVNEITNITNYLGDSYNQYIKNIINPYHSEPGKVEDKKEDTVNPLFVLQTMRPGQVLYGASVTDPKTKKETRTYKADYIVGIGYICDNFKELEATKTALTDQKRMFDTYDRVAYTGTGTPYAPNDVESDTIYYENVDYPFTTYTECVNQCTSPDASMELKRLSSTSNYSIYNASETRFWALFTGTSGVEQCPDLYNNAKVNTASIACRRAANDSNLSYTDEQYITRWKYDTDSGNHNLYAYIFAIAPLTLNSAWKTLYGKVLTFNSSHKVQFHAANTTFSAGTIVYGGIIVVYEREYGAVVHNTSAKEYTCASNLSNTYEYYWNLAVGLPPWWNNESYGNGRYRNHFVYVRRSIFHSTPTYITNLGINTEVFSNGNIIDSRSWIYDTTQKMVFLGCNSIKYTGFVSNKKYANYYFDTTAGSNTDDDDITGVIVGGYTDSETGILNVLSLVRSYSSGSPLVMHLNPGGSDSGTIFEISNQNQTIHIRHLNGRYGYYLNGSTKVYKPYNSTNNYVYCDPDVIDATTGAINTTLEPGYYDTPYSACKATVEGTTYLNKSHTIYKDVYVNTGPTTIGDKTVSIGGTSYIYSNYTTTKNGMREQKDTNPAEATKNWNNDTLVIQSVLDVIGNNGLIFARSSCVADQEMESSAYNLQMMHVKPYHTSSTSFTTWWNRITNESTKNGILAAIKSVFKTSSGGSITDDNIALAILRDTIWKKHELSTLTAKDLTLDDLFKLYHGGGQLWAGDPATNCYTNGGTVNLGYTQGYGYLNASSKVYNSRYRVTKTPGLITIYYYDLFHQVGINTASTDNGVKYLSQRHPYAGHITIVLQYVPDPNSPDNINEGITTITISQGSNELTYQNNDIRLNKIVAEPTSYGYIGCSNPLTCFTSNTFIDKDSSTIYDLATNRIYYVDSNNKYQLEKNLNATSEIYKKFGPGRIISNDITGKLYYTRGDSQMVQRIV